VAVALAVAVELRISRAAEKLDVAQPAVSEQIRKLERGLGVAPPDRTRRRIALTEARRRRGLRRTRDAEPSLRLTFEAIELRQETAFVSAAGPTASASNVRRAVSVRTVVTLTDLRVANLAGAIDEVHGRPAPVSVRVASDEVVVQSSGIPEPALAHGTVDRGGRMG
jgi:DNA-binding transcriptional LysR family regulator